MVSQCQGNYGVVDFRLRQKYFSSLLDFCHFIDYFNQYQPICGSDGGILQVKIEMFVMERRMFSNEGRAVVRIYTDKSIELINEHISFFITTIYLIYDKKNKFQ